MTEGSLVFTGQQAKASDLYVLVGFYSDLSGCKLFGIYDVERTANDRLTILEAANTIYSCRVIKMKLNEACPQEVF